LLYYITVCDRPFGDKKIYYLQLLWDLQRKEEDERSRRIYLILCAITIPLEFLIVWIIVKFL
jgi:hypothetical protein